MRKLRPWLYERRYGPEAAIFVEIEAELEHPYCVDVMSWLVKQPRGTWPSAAKWAMGTIQLMLLREEAVAEITQRNCLLVRAHNPDFVPEDREAFEQQLAEATLRVEKMNISLRDREQWLNEEKLRLVDQDVDLDGWKQKLGDITSPLRGKLRHG